MSELVNSLLIAALTGAHLVDKYLPHLVFAFLVMAMCAIAIHYCSKRI